MFIIVKKLVKVEDHFYINVHTCIPVYDIYVFFEEFILKEMLFVREILLNHK